jgi:hypothetical protein
VKASLQGGVDAGASGQPALIDLSLTQSVRYSLVLGKYSAFVEFDRKLQQGVNGFLSCTDCYRMHLSAAG